MSEIKCWRCNRQVELKRLQLSSEEKNTEVYLCNICFNAARELWKKFLSREGMPKTNH